MVEWTRFEQVLELKDLASGGGGQGEPSNQVAASSGPASPYAVPSSTPGSPPAGTAVPNYLWQSIVATVLCCVPFGVVAIVYAAKVDTLVAQGDVPAAVEASKKAKLWTNLPAGLGLLFAVLYIGFGILAGTLEG